MLLYNDNMKDAKSWNGTGKEAAVFVLFQQVVWGFICNRSNDKGANIAAVTVKGEAVTLKRNQR